MLFLAVVLAVAWVPARPDRPDLLVQVGALGLAAAALVSSLPSPHRGTSLAQTAVLLVMLVMVVGTGYSRWRPAPGLLRGDLVAMTVTGSFWSLTSTALVLAKEPWAIGPYGRAVGVFSNANYLGMVSATSLVTALALTLGVTDVRRRRWAFAATFVLLVPVALSQSRGAALAAAAGVIVTLLALGRSRAALAALVAGLAAAVGAALLVPDLLSRLPTDDVTSGRWALWRTLLELWAQHPVVGIGYRTTELVAGMSAHNILLATLVETGVIGLLALLAVMVGALWSGRRSPLLGAVVCVLVAEQSESTLFGWAGPTALTAWLVLIAHGRWGQAQKVAKLSAV
ncbi:O-antigen ligase family protein [Cellulomonas humilata]|uniref:O-antigen ligase n=1 Tax=Cellulomonas humilata TaxID=144055 RepID=A0ABU0EG38_9CELL|nr:O-antigen ligase family protein [Cellulomonas humilata]MDQ0374231.1 O-antigen ligase [Cellulomonas humilata]